MPPLGLSETHRLLSDGVGVDLPRPDLVRIHEASGGNPLFALELARSGDGRLPANLREALDERLDKLPPPTADVLLEAAALGRPTVDAVAGDPATREALESALDARVVELDGDAVRFTHPLLAARCYDRATPWQRRDVHGRLARKVGDVEQHARHTALASDGADEAVASELGWSAVWRSRPHCLSRCSSWRARRSSSRPCSRRWTSSIGHARCSTASWPPQRSAATSTPGNGRCSS